MFFYHPSGNHDLWPDHCNLQSRCSWCPTSKVLFIVLGIPTFCIFVISQNGTMPFCEITKWQCAILWFQKFSKLTILHFCHFVKSQNGNVPFCDFTSFQNWFCDFTKWHTAISQVFKIDNFGFLWFHKMALCHWHPAILWNHKNAKSIVICLNLKITKEGGNSRQFFPATFLKIKFHNWPGLNFRGWPTWKTKQQSSFFQHVGSSFFGIHLGTVYVFSLLGAISETHSSSLQPHPPMNLPPSTHVVIFCFFLTLWCLRRKSWGHA